MTPNHFIRKTLLVAGCLLTISTGVFAAPDFVAPGFTPGFESPNFAISDKLLHAFQHTFPDAIQVKWMEEPQGYTVSFRQNDILTKVEYDKDANFVSSLRYYSEKNLPITILCQLQRKFPGKTVFGVTELSSESATNYFIKLVDDRNWYTIRSDSDGNMQVTEKYKKAA